MFLQQAAILDDAVKAEQGFAPGDTCAKGAHHLCLLYDLFRVFNPPVICIDHVPVLAIGRERAVPA
jgi:hypothetical protein